MIRTDPDILQKQKNLLGSMYLTHNEHIGLTKEETELAYAVFDWLDEIIQEAKGLPDGWEISLEVRREKK